MNIKLGIIGVLLGVGGLWTAFGGLGDADSKSLTLEVGEHTFYVEKAVTEEEKAIGLMNRSELALDRGMLFIYDEEVQPSFWMRNTLIPLDIIFIDKNKEITQIATAQPCPFSETQCPTYESREKVQYVLELNAGTAQEKKIKVGDLVSF